LRPWAGRGDSAPGHATREPATDIRKIVTIVDETRREVGRPVEPPVRRVIVAAVLQNPFAGDYVEDLTPLIEASVPLGEQLATAAAAQLNGKPVESYGKGGIVGMRGELEHVAAMLHPKFGAPLREAVGGGTAIIPSAKKRGGAGTPLDIPLHFKNAAFVRTHFDAVELRITDAPGDDELVIAVAVTDGGRPLPRVGGLTVDEIVGQDGLR
jgi:Amino acid synthesis